ncbi:hypothetical protein [Acidocella aminolytica]|uniref:Phage protein n=1 Tax=Acidocella aminolytica 101 = DSM 11237 TaxID=1120923 RepID=A0A0D6PFZ6_9PROT|nr:hypothetical protein [Acidocella aminolytica]GAN79784.1 phage protein [Acidocella aminolytica 101 = DSM 11237]GBQ32043.1 hypothetical protein AA11237_0052 [Acidocella aminolytica 101 = DSM 11237]SHF35641.1 hypothetical protein SAMN02746095_02948 [Acidocella aminolytica 101 = DSM 11237]
MAISDFPTALQPIIQQGFLEREFEQGLRAAVAYRAIADREDFPNGIGETITKTRAGLKPTVTTPLNSASNTGLDNGMNPGNNTFPVEQFTLSLNLYAVSGDLNTVTTRVGIVGQFLQNALTNGDQAMRSLDELARNALFGSYFNGNTRVTTTLAAAGPSIAVDDIRGFTQVPGVAALGTVANASPGAGVNPSPTWVPVGASNPLTVTVGSNTYEVVGYTVDANNTSSLKFLGGVSGTLTLSGNVTVADGTAGNTVQAANASTVLRPNARGNSSLLQAGDVFTMSDIQDAVAFLGANGVPRIEGAYNCYLDSYSSRQLFSDPDFRQLFQGATSSNDVFKYGRVSDMLGVRFIPTTQAPVQAHPSIAGLKIRRPIICGQGALIEGDFEGMADPDHADQGGRGPVEVHMVDNVAMTTRAPMDRLGQIVAQSWYWIGGFCVPSDVTTSPTTIGTASNSSYKRAVIVEHVG